jgi:hypothetical protein
VGSNAQWQDWRRDVFGDPYMVWHDGADFTRLTELAKEDRDGVGRMLALGLAAHDELAARSIAYLNVWGVPPENAETLLRDASENAKGNFLTAIAQALRAITKEESWAAAVVHVLRTGSDDERWHAAQALQDFAPTTDLVDALTSAVSSRGYLTRYHAANTLLRYAADQRQIANIPEIFDKIKSGTNRSTRETAAATLRSMVALS